MIRPKSLSGNTYFYIVVDDATNERFTEFSATKDQVYRTLRTTLLAINAKTNKWPRWIRLDGGKEFGEYKLRD
jgi:hypothetical protein